MFRILPASGCSDKMAVILTVPGSAGWVVPPVQAVLAARFQPSFRKCAFSHFNTMPSRPTGTDTVWVRCRQTSGCQSSWPASWRCSICRHAVIMVPNVARRTGRKTQGEPGKYDLLIMIDNKWLSG